MENLDFSPSAEPYLDQDAAKLLLRPDGPHTAKTEGSQPIHTYTPDEWIELIRQERDRAQEAFDKDPDNPEARRDLSASLCLLRSERESVRQS